MINQKNIELNILSKYKHLVQSLPKIIDISGYRNEYIAKKLGLVPTSFSVKKQRNKFSFDDVEKIINVIYNDDVSDYILGLEMETSLEDSTNINLTYDELKKEMQWR